MELTDPSQPEPCEVTVYQAGWRLGGKGASGRRQDTGQRIEEHGLHIWFGFYANAFDVIKRAYSELARTEGPIKTWRDAFEPCSTVVLYGNRDGTWAPKAWSFPQRDDEEPGIGNDPGHLRIITRLLDVFSAGRPDDPGLLPGPLAGRLDGLNELFGVAADADNDFGLDDLLQIGQDVGNVLGIDVPSLGLDDLLEKAIDIVGDLRTAVWPGEDSPLPDKYDDYAMAVDIALAVMKGIRDENLLERGFGVANDRELSAWLLEHGARERTVAESPLLRAFYQLIFGFDSGDRDKRCVAAGKAAQVLIRMVATYKGAVLWKMQAGMGDAIFAPMYEVLKARGVRFEFFHVVESLGVTEDGKRIGSIEVTRQATATGGEYDPLVTVCGLPCWPHEPCWERLDDSAGTLDRSVNFEVVDPGVKAAGDTRTLVLGTDFDDVVLAIPPGGLTPMCDELAAANTGFATMLDKSKTVATQALQIWVKPLGLDLGWEWWQIPTVAGAYLEPLDTYCDMTHLLKCEEWAPEDDVGHCAYFCGVMRDVDGEDWGAAQERAKADGLAHVREKLAPVWPGSSAGGGEFDFDLLVDPGNRAGAARFEGQYWRANSIGADRYVLTPPGTIKHRLRPHESGFENLVLAGDWTRNGICGGSVEAAVTSGRLAAQALTGYPKDVPGVQGWLFEDLAEDE